MNRRKLLKGLATLPIASRLLSSRQVFAQNAQPPAKQRPILHLYCHGLHAFILYQDHILLLTPPVMFHKYMAGAWKQEVSMKKGEIYSLTGVSEATPRPGINRNNLYFAGVKEVRTDLTYCQVRLPYPRQFMSMRYVKANFDSNDKTNHALQISEVPLLQVLEYEISDLPGLQMDHFTGWAPRRDSLLQQLHIFAEPDMIVPDDHALSAFKVLMEMFSEVDLRLTSIPGRPVCPPPADPNDALGIVLEQEESLTERNQGCQGELNARLRPNVKGRPKGAQPANCFSVIANAP